MATVTRVVAEVAADIRQYTNGLRQAARDTEAFARDVQQAAGRSLAFDGDVVARQGASVARDLTRAITGRFQAEMSAARESMARGLSNAEGFAAAGQQAARAYNAAVLKQIDGLARSGQLTAPIRAALVDSLKDAGMAGGRAAAANAAASGARIGTGFSSSLLSGLQSGLLGGGGIRGVVASVGAEMGGLRGQIGAAFGTEALAGISAVTAGIVGIGVAAGAAYLKIAQLGEPWQQIAGRLKLVSDNAVEAQITQGALVRVANQAGLAVDDASKSYVRIASASKTFGANQQEALQVTRAVSQALAIGNANTQEVASATQQLAQGFGKGRLQAEELNSIMEASVPLTNALAKGLGVGVGELKAMAEAGQITSEKAFRALLSQSAELQQTFDKLPPSMTRAGQALENNLTAAVGRLDAAIGASRNLARLLNFAAEAVDTAFGDPAAARREQLAALGRLEKGRFYLAEQANLTRDMAAQRAAMARGDVVTAGRLGREIALREDNLRVLKATGAEELTQAARGFGGTALRLPEVKVGPQSKEQLAQIRSAAKAAAQAAAAAFEDEVQGVLRASGAFAPLTALGADNPQFYAYLTQARRAYDDVTAALGRQKNQFGQAAQRLRDYQAQLADIVTPDLGDAAFTVAVTADTTAALNAFDALERQVAVGLSRALLDGLTDANVQARALTGALAQSFGARARQPVTVVADVRTNGLQRAAFDMADALRAVSPRLGGLAREADALGVALRSPASAAGYAMDGLRRAAGAAGGALGGIGRTLLSGVGQLLNPLTLFAGVAQRVAQALQPALDALAPSLEKVANVVAAVLAPVFEALGPVIDAILPPLRAILQTVAPILQALAPALGAIANLLRIVFPIIKLASIAFTYLAQIVFTVGAALLRLAGNLIIGFGKVIGGIARAIDKIPGINARAAIRFADGLVNTGRELLGAADQFSKSAKEMARARDEIRRVSIDPVATAADAAGKGLNEVADAAGRATDSVRNLADGFVVAAAVYFARAQAAAQPTAAAPAPSPLPRTPRDPAGGGGTLAGLFAGATVVVAADSDTTARRVVGELVGRAERKAAESGKPTEAYRYLVDAAAAVRSGALRPA